jgi:hypothetical protein
MVEFGHLGKILWGYTWVAGRFSNRHKRYIREENNKLNNRLIDLLLIQMSLLVLYYVIIFSVISLLREDPLSAGILDMFFRKYPIMCLFPPKREFICLKFAQIFNSFNLNDPNWGRQFDSILSLEFGSFFDQYHPYRSAGVIHYQMEFLFLPR